MNDELKQIKKIYGEEMMHLCRELFPTLLEQKGRLLKILTDNLAPTHTLGKQLREKDYCSQFKEWIYSFADKEDSELVDTNKTPFELMKEAGYTLYECKTEEDIQSFKHYYQEDEELCTFHGRRLERCHVFFAIKDGADKLNRNDFKNPEREDEYGTSVISIQFSHGNNNTLSIKNRYNHTVNNPDATFSNNLENIIPGLTKSFENYYGYHIMQGTTNYDNLLTWYLKYVRANDGKYYKYNFEEEGIYYCENNIYIEYGIVQDQYATQKERYILIDDYVVDKQEKAIYDVNHHYIGDEFGNGINRYFEITKIDDLKDGENRLLIIHFKDEREIKIGLSKTNAIISYADDTVEEIPDRFLCNNRDLVSISLPNVISIGDEFLYKNRAMREISLPKVKTIGKEFMYLNQYMKQINLPEVKSIGDRFLKHNNYLENVILPKVEKIGKWFLFDNHYVRNIELPEVKEIGDHFLRHNSVIENVDLPEVKEIGDDFLKYDRALCSINLPKLEIMGSYCLYDARELESIELPELKKVGGSFLSSNYKLSHAFLPKLKIIGDDFLYSNGGLEVLELPEVEEIDYNFLENNHFLRWISLPKVRIINAGFLTNNMYLQSLDLPEVIRIGDYFMAKNKSLEVINTPKIKEIGSHFLVSNKNCSSFISKTHEIMERGKT